MGCGCSGGTPRVLGKARVATQVAPAPRPPVRRERRPFTAYNGSPRKAHGTTD